MPEGIIHEEEITIQVSKENYQMVLFCIISFNTFHYLIKSKMQHSVNIHSICMTGLPFSPRKGCPMFNNVNILILTFNGEKSSKTQKCIYSH